MSQSQSQASGSRTELAEGYSNARRKAVEAVSHGVTRSYEKCTNDKNLPLVLFLREAKELMQARGGENMCRAFTNAAASLRNHPLRIYSKTRLLEVKGVGPVIARKVEKYFWSDPDCQPEPPDAEELEVEQRYFEAMQQKGRTKKAAAAPNTARPPAAPKPQLRQPPQPAVGEGSADPGGANEEVDEAERDMQQAIQASMTDNPLGLSLEQEMFGVAKSKAVGRKRKAAKSGSSLPSPKRPAARGRPTNSSKASHQPASAPAAPAAAPYQPVITEEDWEFSDDEAAAQDVRPAAPSRAGNPAQGPKQDLPAVNEAIVVISSDSEGEGAPRVGPLAPRRPASSMPAIPETGVDISQNRVALPGASHPAGQRQPPSVPVRAMANELLARIHGGPSLLAAAPDRYREAAEQSGPALFGSQASVAQGTQGSANPASLDSLLGAGRQHHTQNRLQAAWRLRGVGEGGSPEETDVRLPPLAPGACFADQYEVALILDKRERFGSHGFAKAVEHLTAMGVTVIPGTLEAGDAMWVAKPHGPGPLYALDTVVERKRIDDLIQSIRGGRYERQRYFLARCGMRRTMYVVEGSMAQYGAQGPSAEACKTVMHRLEVEDGFRVLRTSDSADTLRHYQRITAALQAKYGRLRLSSPGVAGGGEPLPTLSQLERRLDVAKQLTLRDVWGLMLCTVPSVGAETCETILGAFPTPISLWRAYDEARRREVARAGDALEAANGLLAKLPRIGKETSRLVFSSLFAGGWDGQA